MKAVICTRDSTKVPKGFSIFEEVSKYLIFFNCRTKDEDSELIVGHAKAKVSIRKVQSAVKANQKMADRGGGIKMGSQSALQVPRSKGKSSNCRWLCFKSVQECRLGSTRKSTQIQRKIVKSPMCCLCFKGREVPFICTWGQERVSFSSFNAFLLTNQRRKIFSQ